MFECIAALGECAATMKPLMCKSTGLTGCNPWTLEL